MRANLVVEEEKTYQEWFDSKVYNKLKRNKKAEFTFHDGPPYANGNIHIGHALNKILKDTIVKTHFFNNKSVRFTPGWDCHGLPIEQQVEKSLGTAKKESLPKTKIRELCKAHAAKFLDIQRAEFKTLGVLADWDAPYVTMDYKFEANIYRQLCKIAQNKLLSERKKPVFWSWAAKTALAEAEVEYEDKEDFSIYVAFGLGEKAQKIIGQKASVLIWTTTPWTLPANMAVALNPDEPYVLTKEGLIVAQKRLDALKQEGVLSGEFSQIIDPKTLENLEAINPLNDRKSLLILASHVLMESGSGCVHTAPGHGEDDYKISLEYELDIVMPVDEDGRYDETIVNLKLFKDPQKYLKMHVFDANEQILQELGSSLIFHKKFIHSYPFCWRTHKPIIYRATKQWFILMDSPVLEGGKTLRQKALEELENVKFYPKTGINRLKTMIENRPDWCISRQRDWGVPIAFFRHKTTKEVILDQEVLNFIAMIFEKMGCDAWYSLEIKDLLNPKSSLDPNELEKVNDILDVWFDSGSTQACVLESGNYDAGEFPASMYLEGSDQHRGWFQSSLLVSIASGKQAPYKSIVTHGFTMDERGEKMSKSKGNVVAPNDVVKKYGSEILRLWVAMSDYQNDQKISENILKQVSDLYRKLRNTIRFLLANIDDLDTPLDLSLLSTTDKWVLKTAKDVFDDANKSFLEYDFSKALNKINNFLIVDLSGIYLDICKDRLYCNELNSPQRRASQTAMFYILQSLLGLIAPILTFTANEAINHAPAVLKQGKTDIFDITYQTIPSLDTSVDFTDLKQVRDVFYTKVDELKKQNKIKSTLELFIYTDAKLGLNEQDLSDWFLVSGVFKRADKQGVLDSFLVGENEFLIALSNQTKCPRCWKLNAQNNAVCKRCADVLSTIS